MLSVSYNCNTIIFTSLSELLLFQKGKLMTYHQFVEAVIEQLNNNTSEDMHAEMHSSLKNNGFLRLGILFTDTQTNVSPTIYMEEFYQEYQQGLALSEIVAMVLEIYHEIRFDHSWELSELLDFTSIEQHIVYKLIHKKENDLLLMDVPFIPYHDLAIVFYVFFETKDFGTGSILITSKMLAAWKVTVDDLYRAASANTPRLLPPTFSTMYSVLCQMLGTDCLDTDIAENHMYILTNALKQFGAAAILYKGLLEEIAYELGDDYYLLPSSLHEFIILPRRYSPSTEDLDRMISDINATQVSPDEILSDHSYYYSRMHKSLFLTH